MLEGRLSVARAHLTYIEQLARDESFRLGPVFGSLQDALVSEMDRQYFALKEEISKWPGGATEDGLKSWLVVLYLVSANQLLDHLSGIPELRQAEQAYAVFLVGEAQENWGALTGVPKADTLGWEDDAYFALSMLHVSAIGTTTPEGFANIRGRPRTETFEQWRDEFPDWIEPIPSAALFRGRDLRTELEAQIARLKIRIRR